MGELDGFARLLRCEECGEVFDRATGAHKASCSRASLPSLYAVNELGEVCLSLPRAIEALKNRDDPESDLIAEWLGNCEALAQEWRPEDLLPAEAPRMIASAVIALLEEAPDEQMTISPLRLANLCGLSWGGNHGTAKALRRMCGVKP